jgi:hypothetical protein
MMVSKHVFMSFADQKLRYANGASAFVITVQLSPKIYPQSVNQRLAKLNSPSRKIAINQLYSA